MVLTIKKYYLCQSFLLGRIFVPNAIIIMLNQLIIKINQLLHNGI